MREFWLDLNELVKDWNTGSIMARLIIAMFIGILIGLDRERKNRGAGIKTHVLVCVGAALTMLTGQYIINYFPGVSADIGRIGAQVVSGVGFLGVGTIIVTGQKHVRGLTTAAGLWATACAGIAIGIGFLEGAAIALLIIIFNLFILDILDKWVHTHNSYYDYYFEFNNNHNISEFITFLKENNIKFTNFNLQKNGSGMGPVLTLTLQLKTKAQEDAIQEYINNKDDVIFAQEV
ncbi:MAG: MgtC/SapB family protein [Eubacterium sp.]|nr:MgtC/SapB family protein [Eubacterium sp.]